MISDLRSQSHPSLSVKGSPGPWSPSPSEPARPAHGTRSVLPTFRFSAAVSSCMCGNGHGGWHQRSPREMVLLFRFVTDLECQLCKCSVVPA